MSNDLSLCDEYCTTCSHGYCTHHDFCIDCASSARTIWHETNEIHLQDILNELVIYQPPPESPVEETPIVETPNE